MTRDQIKNCNACLGRQCSFCPANAPLAVTVRNRRAELGINLRQAEILSGIDSLRWLALEYGSWIPDDRSEMRAIADTLEANVSVISMLAFLSHYAAA